MGYWGIEAVRMNRRAGGQSFINTSQESEWELKFNQIQCGNWRWSQKGNCVPSGTN